MRAVLIAAFVLAASIGAFAERDGNLLLHYCTATVSRADGGHLNEEMLRDDFKCLSYIAGFIDALDTISSVNKAAGKEDLRALTICSPENKLEQFARVFVKYARAHPEDLHLLASDVLAFALHDAFPCSGGQK